MTRQNNKINKNQAADLNLKKNQKPQRVSDKNKTKVEAKAVKAHSFKVCDVEKILGFIFKDKNLLVTACTHASFGNFHKTDNNEKLEFLGDSVLGFIAADLLFEQHLKSEGKLSKAHDRIVCNDCLATKADELGLAQYLLFIKSADTDTISSNLKADMLEAVIGAIYKDGGLEKARDFVYRTLIKSRNELRKTLHQDTDYKTKLQEVLQEKGYKTGDWIYLEEKIQEDPPCFKVVLCLNGKALGAGEGGRIKDASQEAAKAALAEISN